MRINPNTPIWQLTVGEFLELQKLYRPSDQEVKKLNPEKRYVYGIDGLALLFGCSRSKAVRIKQSGKIDAAIKQNGRKIIVDANLAIELFNDNKNLKL